MVDNLAGLTSCSCEAKSEDDVVETKLEQLHQVLTCHARHSVCLLIIVAERLLKNAVNELCLLLLTELQTVLRNLAA